MTPSQLRFPLNYKLFLLCQKVAKNRVLKVLCLHRQLQQAVTSTERDGQHPDLEDLNVL